MKKMKKMKKIISIKTAFLALILLIMFSCSNKNEIKSMEEKINHAEQKSSELTKSDWDDLAEDMRDFEIFVEDNKKEFSLDERSKANNLIGKYNRILLEKQLNDVESELNDYTQKFEGLIN